KRVTSRPPGPAGAASPSARSSAPPGGPPRGVRAGLGLAGRFRSRRLHGGRRRRRRTDRDKGGVFEGAGSLDASHGGLRETPEHALPPLTENQRLADGATVLVIAQVGTQGPLLVDAELEPYRAAGGDADRNLHAAAALPERPVDGRRPILLGHHQRHEAARIPLQQEGRAGGDRRTFEQPPHLRQRVVLHDRTGLDDGAPRQGGGGALQRVQGDTSGGGGFAGHVEDDPVLLLAHGPAGHQQRDVVGTR